MLNIKKDGEVTIVGFSGVSRFNTVISQSVKDDVSAILNTEGTKLVIDLTGIRFIDSSAFGTLIALLKQSKETNSKIKFCNASTEVVELINVMQLDSVFDIYADIEACISSF